MSLGDDEIELGTGELTNEVPDGGREAALFRCRFPGNQFWDGCVAEGVEVEEDGSVSLWNPRGYYGWYVRPASLDPLTPAAREFLAAARGMRR